MRVLLIKSLLRLLSWLPLSVNHSFGSLLGWLLYVIPHNRTRSVSATNLKLCFPDLDELEQDSLLRQSLIEAGKTLTELGALWHWKPERLRALIKEVSGEHILESALAQEKGIIILTPHLGAWEITTLYFTGKTHTPATCLYSPQRLVKLDQMMQTARQRMGISLMPANQSGVKSMYRALSNKEIVGILPDQVPRDGQNIFAPFFGVEAATMVLVNRLARKTGAPVIFIYAERLGGGCGYHIHFLSAPAGIDDRDTVKAASALNTGVENCVRDIPEQYQWSYKRFKVRPEGERLIY